MRPPRPDMADSARDWGFVTVLAIAQLVSWGALYYSFSLFVLPMETELGWTRTEINGALSLGLVVAALCTWPVGAWIDKRGGRSVMTLGSVVTSVLLVAWSQVETVVQFYIVWAALGFAVAATLYEPALAVIARRYGEYYRNRMTVLTLVAGFASTVFIPLTQLLIETLGWRGALVALAAINLAIALPIHAFLLRESGRGAVSSRVGQSGLPDGASNSLRSALRRPVFWALALSFPVHYASFAALSFHMVPLLVERGITMSLVVAALALVGPAQVAGRLLLLAIGDRASVQWTGRIVMLLPSLAALVLLVFPPTMHAVVAFAVLYGAANGTFTIVRATAVPDLMGRTSYGALNGALAAPSNLAKAFAPFAAAALWTATGGYDAVLIAACAATTVAAGSFWLAVSLSGGRTQRQRAPSERGDLAVPDGQPKLSEDRYDPRV